MLDDTTGIVNFIKTIEKHPVIYDYTRADHNRRDVFEKAWETISREANLTVPHCKRKWKNLRTAFARSIKKTPLGFKKVKDYYLKDSLDFLLPYMKSYSSLGVLMPLMDDPLTADAFDENSESNGSDENGSNSTKLMDFSPAGPSTQNISSSTKIGAPSPVQSTSNTVRVFHEDDMDGPKPKRKKSSTKLAKSLTTEAVGCFIDFINHKKSQVQVPQPNNADLEFLKGLLPDIEKMNDYQRRQFKRRTLEVIDSILCDGPGQN